ncbi:saccharopine dehydrogenase family protein [Thalassotalea sp. PS06]|uniref:saccharopine dehydrogenase family protein n=1 Tax=Thalassotalea sp. PS06 TaxID=2594005 RepID=UPI001164D664|nr:saccharopine dehydrogenase NADP-binding domain-containing protein [Thalassotalea sp. PS06]QDO99935.1 saccharopine dehydrogenase [Thalassotalea sp. PS06]
MKNVVILGGYGNFGKRICEALIDLDDVIIYIAGRNPEKAERLKNQLQPKAKAVVKTATLDINDSKFASELSALSPDLVIHTGGPFQGQDYGVPEVCINAGAHYIDLADDRRFVCDITNLDTQARDKGVLVVSGASSVPGLSSAVIDHYREEFSSISTIDIAIAPGNKAERGLATVAGILSYTGHPFPVFRDGIWQQAYGWMDPKVEDFGAFARKRYLANVDIPDLELYPDLYQVSERVSFQAGLELGILHYGMVAMAYLCKIGLVKNWQPLAKPIVAASNYFGSFGTDKGAMRVKIAGIDLQGQDQEISWTLYAPDGNGPYIPTLSTIILARKLLCDEAKTSLPTGAKPCVNLLELEDFNPYFDTYKIHYHSQIRKQNWEQNREQDHNAGQEI